MQDFCVRAQKRVRFDMFSYNDLLNETEMFCRVGAETGDIGESELGRRIPYIFVGNKNGNYMIVQAAIHAREHLTSLLCVNLAKYLITNSRLKMLGGIYFVPMVNPDGVSLCQRGAKFLSIQFAERLLERRQHKQNFCFSSERRNCGEVGFVEENFRNKATLGDYRQYMERIVDDERKTLIALNGGSEDFSLWKANIDGVDLNTNFDARWGEGAQNVFVPSAAGYVGEFPFSARESLALAEFTSKIKPLVTLSYHLKGEEIYWEFGQKSHRRFRDLRFAQAISRYTGYKIVNELPSAGGYKDWCVEKFRIPSFTIEVGNDKFSHPFPYSEFPVIFEQNKDLPRRLLNTMVQNKARLDKAGFGDIMR